MNRLLILTVATGSILLGLCVGCDKDEEIVMTPEGTFSASYLQGRDLGRRYGAKELPDYEVVWSLAEVRTDLRAEFLDGFQAGLAQGGTADAATAWRTILQDAMAGTQFETARELGGRHAAGAVTSEQVQGTLHSSLGVSRGVALGWKAGYIKGYAARRIADLAAAESVSEARIKDLHAEAAATYHALRASIGP